ncbi:MAG: dTMP kinase [Verrucomicrobiales bacterium]|jgi:dTMP kinase|nr:dTMP kinase [bacterium]|tara:strand:- start:191 stop:766 length:576 start_codon:yes stop_codon:yes gene_type:complete
MFIVFEGIDGTGKSTQVKLLAEALRAQGHEVITSKEPTDGPHGSKLRQSAETGRLSAQEELDLFHMDRKEHVEDLIKPALDRGVVVILDRYFFSTMAYQGIRGFDPTEIRRLNEKFAPIPDFVFILELDLDIALSRIGGRDGQANEFEQRDALQKCHDVFASLTDGFIHRIDAGQTPANVHKDVLSDISGR